MTAVGQKQTPLDYAVLIQSLVLPKALPPPPTPVNLPACAPAGGGRIARLSGRVKGPGLIVTVGGLRGRRSAEHRGLCHGRAAREQERAGRERRWWADEGDTPEAARARDFRFIRFGASLSTGRTRRSP